MASGDETARLDVLGIGNAIVDVLSATDDETLVAHDLPKGGMTLIDAERADALYNQMGPGVEVSGGSCANTMAGIASLGGRAAFRVGEAGRRRGIELSATYVAWRERKSQAYPSKWNEFNEIFIGSNSK